MYNYALPTDFDCGCGVVRSVGNVGGKRVNSFFSILIFFFGELKFIHLNYLDRNFWKKDINRLGAGGTSFALVTGGLPCIPVTS
jgi:hypothetical protein